MMVLELVQVLLLLLLLNLGRPGPFLDFVPQPSLLKLMRDAAFGRRTVVGGLITFSEVSSTFEGRYSFDLPHVFWGCSILPHG